MRRLLALAVCALLAAPAALAGVTGRATVIDGDTIEIRGERIRLDPPPADPRCCHPPQGAGQP